MITLTNRTIGAYLNTMLVRREEFTLVTMDNEADWIFGPFFEGGIGDLLAGEFRGEETLGNLKDNLWKLHAPNCKPYLDLSFQAPDPYRF